MILLHVVVEFLVASDRSDLKLVGVPHLFKRLRVADQREKLRMLQGTFTADESAESDVSVGAPIVLAVNAEGIEFVLLDQIANVSLLLVWLRNNWEARLHLF